MIIWLLILFQLLLNLCIREAGAGEQATWVTFDDICKCPSHISRLNLQVQTKRGNSVGMLNLMAS